MNFAATGAATATGCCAIGCVTGAALTGAETAIDDVVPEPYNEPMIGDAAGCDAAASCACAASGRTCCTAGPCEAAATFASLPRSPRATAAVTRPAKIPITTSAAAHETVGRPASERDVSTVAPGLKRGSLSTDGIAIGASDAGAAGMR